MWLDLEIHGIRLTVKAYGGISQLILDTYAVGNLVGSISWYFFSLRSGAEGWGLG